MGGLIIIFATLVSVMLFSKLHNIYIVLLISYIYGWDYWVY
jgi:phospho-N-acetylmuramoyl-pentapeptide-transferase